jgi:hypothetical protein
MSKQWRDPKTRGTALSKGSARGQKNLGEKVSVTYKNRAFIFGNCHYALAGCTKDGIQASLPSPIFETGAKITKAETSINIGKTSVDVATDFMNQPDQWCQAFQFAYSHLLSTKQHPSPLELVEILLFISSDRANNMLRDACLHAIKMLEKKEFKHFNEMLPSWDDPATLAYAKDSAKYQAERNKDNVPDDVQEMVDWIAHLHRESLFRKQYYPHFTVNAKTRQPEPFNSFITRKPTGSHLFEVEAGVILESNPIAHLRNHQYGFLYYKQFFDHVIKYVQERVFRDYGGYDNAAEQQLAYLENDLDISGSNIHADKFFQLLGTMETLFQAFPLETCTRLGQKNSIPDSSKKKIAFTAMHQKYNKQLQARSKMAETHFGSWSEMERVFIECQRAYVEEEKSNKAAQKEQDKKGQDSTQPNPKKQKTGTTECGYCKETLGKYGKAVEHSIKDCHKLKAALNKTKSNSGGGGNGGQKNQKWRNSISAILKNAKVSKDDAIAMLQEEKDT